jgi:hypothetical protein
MRTKPFIIEEKLDGERIQLHKRGHEYFYCSRRVIPAVPVPGMLLLTVGKVDRKAKDYGGSRQALRTATIADF